MEDLCKILEFMYPKLVNVTHFGLIDLSDGNGPKIQDWVPSGRSCIAEESVGAGVLTRTNISYQVTAYGDAYVSAISSNEIASVTAKNVELTDISVGPSDATDRKIYRKSDETGGQYKLIATITDNTTTTFTDNVADASGGAVAPSTIAPAQPSESTIEAQRSAWEADKASVDAQYATDRSALLTTLGGGTELTAVEVEILRRVVRGE